MRTMHLHLQVVFFCNGSWHDAPTDRLSTTAAGRKQIASSSGSAAVVDNLKVVVDDEANVAGRWLSSQTTVRASKCEIIGPHNSRCCSTL